jgi:hypothetical protein
MTESWKFYVAGVQFHDAKKVINTMAEGEELNIEPEPDNKYDPNAVKLLYGETMVGYVPKKFSASVNGMLDIGEPLVCEITKVDPKAKTWEQIEVEIKEG